MKSNWHVATAAEATAAAQFARLGFDVSVQYGASQPEYDLIVTHDDGRMLKVSVKGSKDGGWGLSQGQLTALRKKYPDGETDYHRAADDWLSRHKPGTIMCFVQFEDAKDGDLPRLYLAWPREVCELLKSARVGKGDTTIKERQKGQYSRIPDNWKMTKPRADELFDGSGELNRNKQKLLDKTDRSGNDFNSRIWIVRCMRPSSAGTCDHVYGVNGTDFFQRKCPKCQDGEPGLTLP